MKIRMKDVLRELQRRGDVRFGLEENRKEGRQTASVEAQRLWKEVESDFRKIKLRLDRIYGLWDNGRGDSSLLDFISKASKSVEQASLAIQRVQYKLKNAERK